MFREVACKRFAKLQCQDLDLLHVSQMIAREGNSLASVGACLRTEGKVIFEIEKDESCPKLKDKVHKILLQWQWKNTCNATWASLITPPLGFSNVVAEQIPMAVTHPRSRMRANNPASPLHSFSNSRTSSSIARA